ncbi:MAG: butyrate kinase [Bacteroidales bacterium]|nr:butyrate kinase [Bacteroidales bacterium]
MDTINILAINPGSTSTKIAVFVNSKQIFLKSIKHPTEELAPFPTITDQYEFRKKVILDELKHDGIDISSINVVIGCGGLIKPITSGVYEVNEAMKTDLRAGVLGLHASNLGGLIADDIAKTISGAKAYIADPVVVDEMDDIARVSGHPAFERVSIFHALNSKAVSRIYAQSIGKKYEELNLIVAHLGGGVSVGAHRKGQVIDVNNALDGDGPFSPERSGSLPVGALARACFSGQYTHDDIKKMITGKGGYVAYLNTNDAYEVEKAATAGDQKATLIQDALAYQVSKEIGAMSTVLKGEVDAIILTGGIAYGKPFVEAVSERIKHLGQIYVHPGEGEMEALAMNGLLVATGQIEPKVYS